eukprot:351126-Chlamydomonas_euryale.AAC.9
MSIGKDACCKVRTLQDGRMSDAAPQRQWGEGSRAPNASVIGGWGLSGGALCRNRPAAADP